LERRIGKSAQPKASAVTNENIFATPRKVEDVADCYFYHTMELPGRGVIEGRDWDLRAEWMITSGTSILPVNEFWKSVLPAVS
jgi:hypothetical protein